MYLLKEMASTFPAETLRNPNVVTPDGFRTSFGGRPGGSGGGAPFVTPKSPYVNSFGADLGGFTSNRLFEGGNGDGVNDSVGNKRKVYIENSMLPNLSLGSKKIRLESKKRGNVGELSGNKKLMKSDEILHMADGKRFRNEGMFVNE